MARALFALLTGGGILALSAGCATTPIARGSRLVVTKPAEFYRHGPAQDSGFEVAKFADTADAFGPDLQLASGTSVTMVKREFGYSKVMTESGEVGYMANEFMRLAPPIVQAAPAEARRQRPARERRRSIPPVRQPEEQLDLSDIPLPLPS